MKEIILRIQINQNLGFLKIKNLSILMKFNYQNILIFILFLMVIYLFCNQKKNKENFSNGFQDDQLLEADIQRKVNKVVDDMKLSDLVKKLTSDINTKNTIKIDNEVSKNISKIDGAIKKIPNTVDARVKVIYKTDIDAIRNLSNVSNKLQSGGLKVPGNLDISGDLTGKSINYLNKRLSTLNSKIDNNYNTLNSKADTHYSILNKSITKINNSLGGYVRFGDGIGIVGDWRKFGKASHGPGCGGYCRAVGSMGGHQRNVGLGKFMFVKH